MEAWGTRGRFPLTPPPPPPWLSVVIQGPETEAVCLSFTRTGTRGFDGPRCSWVHKHTHTELANEIARPAVRRDGKGHDGYAGNEENLFFSLLLCPRRLTDVEIRPTMGDGRSGDGGGSACVEVPVGDLSVSRIGCRRIESGEPCERETHR